ncbi:MAG: deoxyribodipyrimidine photo-lyase [Candidatus Scalindua sp.]|nr:MAG: deoxyribodipyrimidine photo-lyase [Candidatus Scalindua sp.]
MVYWMSRDQRAKENWALLFTQDLAQIYHSPVIVVFCLVPQFLGATFRQYHFMVEGLKEVEKTLAEKNIPFFLLTGLPNKKIPEFVKKHKVSALVTDFSPLRIKKEWKREVAQRIDIPFYEVDAHNIVPCWTASPKQEYGAYSFRPKIHRTLPEFLENYPRLKRHPITWKGEKEKTDWGKSMLTLKIDQTVPPVDCLKPGEKRAQKILRDFLRNKLLFYDKDRNDPTKDAQSNLSPYIHFGQISAQRIALEVLKSSFARELTDLFLEELIVRRELSDNFCYYNPDYDSIKAFPSWAKETLDKHRRDRREYLYTQDQLEYGHTHDPLWNASQMEMVKRGKLHGYMRMYWGKKIMEWTESPEYAMKIAIYLNDKYELDGRDPNGYTGIAWCMGGVHDRAWKERDIFGKVRYMNYNGCKSKFNIKTYIEKWLN